MVNVDAVDILLVEDNPNDVELTLRALKRHNLANNVMVVRDSAEALDFVFGEGAYAHRSMEKHPKLVLLDLKLPKVDGLDVLRSLFAIRYSLGVINRPPRIGNTAKKGSSRGYFLHCLTSRCVPQ